jgi:hypothetical protein
MEQVTIIDALNVVEGTLRVYIWDDLRRAAANRLRAKLRPEAAPAPPADALQEKV